MKNFLAFFVIIFSVNVQAGYIDCGKTTLKTVYVQADRSDNSFHGNKLLIIMGDDKNEACTNITFAYLENDDDAYNSVLSMAMSAFMAGKKLRVVVSEGAEDSPSNKRIEWVNF
jgi:hypothetical protein